MKPYAKGSGGSGGGGGGGGRIRRFIRRVIGR